MSVIQLPRNVQFMYEEHLAKLEMAALGCTGVRKETDDWRQFSAHTNGNTAAVLRRAAYVGSVDETRSVYDQLIRPAYQGGRFNRTRSVNQYLTHWIYPYRGKFHPQMVRALLNLFGVTEGTRVLEPYVGSGTTALEASLLGADVVGVDISPLCVLLTRVKTRSWTAVDDIAAIVERLLARRELHPDRVEVSAGTDERVREFVKVARMVTYSDMARRNRQPDPSLRRNLSAMLESVRAHAAAVKEFDLTPGEVDVQICDSRDLATAGVTPSSIDVVVTSPPYSIALDYVKNDEHALEALNVDVPMLRTQMSGVRGRGAREKLSLYNDDMQSTFGQVATALKPGGQAAFVVGDATVSRQEVTTTDTMGAWAEEAGLRTVRAIPKIVYGLYSVMKDEKILIFEKP